MISISGVKAHISGLFCCVIGVESRSNPLPSAKIGKSGLPMYPE
jgi:hypothetical protein